MSRYVRRAICPEWTDAECNALRLYYPDGGGPAVLPHVDTSRTLASIERRAYLLGVKMNRAAKHAALSLGLLQRDHGRDPTPEEIEQRKAEVIADRLRLYSEEANYG